MEKIYFLDACAIFEYYRPKDSNNNRIAPLITKNPKRCFISEWGIIETTSALKIAFHQLIEKDRKCTQQYQQEYQQVLERISLDVNNRVFIMEKLPIYYRNKAINLINDAFFKNLSLKAGDAMQLVNFNELRNRFLQTTQTIFVSNDKKLIKFASEKGYSVIDYKNEPLS